MRGPRFIPGLLCLLVSHAAFAQSSSEAVILKGRVVDENEAPIGGAIVRARPAANSSVVIAPATADPTGAFSIALPQPGEYVIDVQREGYYESKDNRVDISEGPRELTIAMNPVHEVFQSTNVSGAPSPTSLDQTSAQQTLTGTDVVDVPFPASASLRNSMRLMPGVIQDPSGSLHFNGGAENQTLYLLDGFDVTEPLTGRFATRLALEGVRTVEFQSGRYSPEFGKGSAGVLQIRTENGADQFHYTITNFIPGLTTQNGLRLSNWTPRANVSGPIVKGRAWFSDSFDSTYSQAFVNGLPAGSNSGATWGGSNLLRTQVNLTPSNVLFASLLVNLNDQTNVGLSPLTPASTTISQRAETFFSSVKDQIYLSHGVLMEFGVGMDRVYNRAIPQGDQPYIITPLGDQGNYFVNSTQHSRRIEYLGNVYLPGFHFLGEHRIKTGFDADRLQYDADFHRTEYQYFGLNAQPLSITSFVGSGLFDRPDLAASSYVTDSWRIRSDLHADLGVRQDWDELVRQTVLSPRAALAWAPWGDQKTRISAGYAITYDAIPLQLFAQPFDQLSATTLYNADGTPEGPPALTTYSIPSRGLRMPRYTNWSAGFDRQIASRKYVSVNYLRKRGSDGFAYYSALNGTGPPAPSFYAGAIIGYDYDLTNSRLDRYDSIELTYRQSFSKQYQWMASYIHSLAYSNAVLSPTADQINQVINNAGPVPWNVPNRILSWGYLPMYFKHWSIVYLLDTHSGFPFSVQNLTGQIVGSADSYRFPYDFDLNIHVEREFTLRGHRFAIRAGFNNITDRANYASVNNIIGSPQYLQFLAPEGRHLVLRIRMFGSAK